MDANGANCRNERSNSSASITVYSASDEVIKLELKLLEIPPKKASHFTDDSFKI